MADGLFAALGAAAGGLLGGGMPGAALGASIGSGLDAGGNAQNQMDFQENMSNTRYQRAIADLQAAGLNPMLAYGQGGAPAMPGSSAQTVDTAGAITNASNSSTSTDLMRAQTEKTHADIALTQQNTAESVSRTATNLEQARQLRLANDSFPEMNLLNYSNLDEENKKRFRENTIGDRQFNEYWNSSGPDGVKNYVKTLQQQMAGVGLANSGQSLSNQGFSLDMARRKNASAFESSPVGGVKPYFDFVGGVLGNSASTVRAMK